MHSFQYNNSKPLAVNLKEDEMNILAIYNSSSNLCTLILNQRNQFAQSQKRKTYKNTNFY